MKWENTVRNTDTVGSIESASIQLLTNAKAFKVIIGNIYTDIQVALVREIFSNAWDAQKEKGNLATPIDIHSPSMFEPWFSVRDYGDSMSHETVSNVYAQIFNSTKDDSNDQVGMYGMGSKSPLGYTDNFTMICFRDGEMRHYDIYLSTEGSPKIDLKTKCATKEPNGTLVQIGVKPNDINSFREKISSFILNVDTPITVNGEKNLSKWGTILSGDNWRMIDLNIKSYIRMGCVLYEAPTAYLNLDDIIIDVPIGTFEVTPSRDSIIINDRSIKILKDLNIETKKKIKERVTEKINSMRYIGEKIRFDKSIRFKYRIDIPDKYDASNKIFNKCSVLNYSNKKILSVPDTLDVVILCPEKISTYRRRKIIREKYPTKNIAFFVYYGDNEVESLLRDYYYGSFFIYEKDITFPPKPKIVKKRKTVKEFSVLCEGVMGMIRFEPEKMHNVYVPKGVSASCRSVKRPEGKHVMILPPSKVKHIKKEFPEFNLKSNVEWMEDVISEFSKDRLITVINNHVVKHKKHYALYQMQEGPEPAEREQLPFAPHLHQKTYTLMRSIIEESNRMENKVYELYPMIKHVKSGKFSTEEVMQYKEIVNVANYKNK